jgi:putative sterol carrier protein
MVEFKVPADVSVDDFFKAYVPKQFQEALATTNVSAMAGKEFTLQFDIGGKKYALKIKDGKALEVIPGGLDKAMLSLKLQESFWRDSITGKIPGAMDQFTDPSQVADVNRYNTLLSTKGTLKVELSKADGQMVPLAMTFNGEATPEVTIKLALDDWLALQKKQADGQSLFLAGKMQFEGDIAFLMQLQSLI